MINIDVDWLNHSITSDDVLLTITLAHQTPVKQIYSTIKDIRTRCYRGYRFTTVISRRPSFELITSLGSKNVVVRCIDIGGVRFSVLPLAGSRLKKMTLANIRRSGEIPRHRWNWVQCVRQQYVYKLFTTSFFRAHAHARARHRRTKGDGKKDQGPYEKDHAYFVFKSNGWDRAEVTQDTSDFCVIVGHLEPLNRLRRRQMATQWHQAD